MNASQAEQQQKDQKTKGVRLSQWAQYKTVKKSVYTLDKDVHNKMGHPI